MTNFGVGTKEVYQHKTFVSQLMDGQTYWDARMVLFDFFYAYECGYVKNYFPTPGFSMDEMVVWDYDKKMGGLTVEQIKQAKMILWKGFCSVHQMFTTEQIDNFKQRYPETKVISHPESSYEVCQQSDYVGSTEYIINTIRDAEPDTRWLVGTELNLVNRLKEQFAAQGKKVHFMSPTVCMCSTMFRIDPQHLAWTLENLVAGHLVNQIKVPADVAHNARLALERMLEVSP